MRLLINLSNQLYGGGKQVALSFIHECQEFNENEYHVLLSRDIEKCIDQDTFPDFFYFYVTRSSLLSVKNFVFGYKYFRKLEKLIYPNCVFTVFGPSYWTPNAPHLLGFARGYYLFPESPFFKRISIIERVKIACLKGLHYYFFKRNAKYFYVESEAAKSRISNYLSLPLENIFAFSNTHHSIFNAPVLITNKLPRKNENEFRLISITGYYSHKNLEILNSVIPILISKSSIEFKFVLTIEREEFANRFENVKDGIINIGPVPIEMCPALYSESDALFLPTLIEIFSASYPEAMKMDRPILTSDLPFAHEICGEAALYFDPLSAVDIADKIIEIAESKTLQKRLILEGKKRLECFGSPYQRARYILDICHQIGINGPIS